MKTETTTYISGRTFVPGALALAGLLAGGMGLAADPATKVDDERQHWAYVRPERPPVPQVEKKDWPRTPIDSFILARLEGEGLAPSPEADPVTLTRRMSFDLTGLPPSPEEADAFTTDLSDEAYEKQVERLLRSPHYGERMAIFWLDLVRFADSRGYHSDNSRNVSPYRDYVIGAFNDNTPFDQFTIEQLAGDLLPEPTLWQRIASCYNKLNQTTDEGGAQVKEYVAKTAADRVRNVSAVWMGATVGCAECHAHKFDPYEAKDFYTLAAFFADVQELSISDYDEGIPVPDEDEASDRWRALGARVADLEKYLESPPTDVFARLAKDQAAWEKVARRHAPRLGPWYAIGPFPARDLNDAFTRVFPPELSLDRSLNIEESHEIEDGGELKWRKEEWPDGAVHRFGGPNSATYLYRTIDVESEGSFTLSLGHEDSSRVWFNGESVFLKEGSRAVKPDQERVRVILRPGSNRFLAKVANRGGKNGFYFKALEDDVVPSNIRVILDVALGQRTEDQKKELVTYYLKIAQVLEKKRAELKAVKKERSEAEEKLRHCLVSVPGSPRVTRVLRRGNWMDESGEVVEPAIPTYFGTVDVGVEDRRATRLDLARWFVSGDNPLTARAFVNRLWKLFFGTGISKNLDDLGAMGEPPVHPELLDWLAVEFVERGWDVKHMVRLLLLSSTYRQSSVAPAATAAASTHDPYNRLLARQSRWRLDAEMVRDNALAVSGLLSRRMGGASVKPYQPAGYWQHMNFPVRKWVTDDGENVYRRGLYTWWQRSFLHPSLMAFDAPNREECAAERPRSNIPQQALALLNDPTYVEAARVFASRVINEAGPTTTERVRWAFHRAVSREPREEETSILTDLYKKHRESYQDDDSARELLGVGQTPVPEDIDLGELAAWTSVARVILNLHETVTRN